MPHINKLNSSYGVRKKIVTPSFNYPSYDKKPHEVLPQNIDSPRNKMKGENTEISQN